MNRGTPSIRERSTVSVREVGRLATVSKNGLPRIATVSYIYPRGFFYAPSDEKATKVRTVERRLEASLVILDRLRDGVSCWSAFQKSSPPRKLRADVTGRGK